MVIINTNNNYHRVSSLCRHALIGRLEYFSLGKKEWIEWASVHWKPLLTYLPTISLLEKGWLVFVFLEDSHASLIIEIIMEDWFWFLSP